MNPDRLKLLEQKVEVVTQEFNQLLQEMQNTLVLLTRSTGKALTSLQAQIDELRKGKEVTPPLRDDDQEGKEL